MTRSSGRGGEWCTGAPSPRLGMELFRAERVFRVWDYSVSHSMSLLSSVHDPPGASQIDVEFGFVNALKLPTHQLRLLLVRDPYLDELSVLGPEVESVCPWAFATGPDRIDHRLFVLDAGDQVGWALASGWMIAYRSARGSAT